MSKKVCKVFLANRGNPDFRQDENKPVPYTESDYFAEVEDREGARDAVMAYITENELGGGNWIGGHYFEDGIMVGCFTYNARYVDEGPLFNNMKRQVRTLKKV